MFYYAINLISRVGLVVVYVLILLLAGSTTNIGVILFCLLLYLLNKMFFIDKKSFAWDLGIIILILTSLGVVYSIINEDDFNFIFNKLVAGSKYYCVARLEFAFSPKAVLL